MPWFGREPPKIEKISRLGKAAMGSFSGMISTTLLHPLDVAKIRMQMYPRPSYSLFRLAKRICRCEGPTALYTGLSAALMRQVTYTTTRLAVYSWLYDIHRNKYGVPNFSDKMQYGLCAGTIGAFAGTPTDVALVRLMADGKKDPCRDQGCFRRQYKGFCDAIYKIATEEGPRSLFRGGWLTLTKGACISVVQIGSYVHGRDYLNKRSVAQGKPLLLHVYTSVITGFMTAIMTLPIDIVKVRYQVRRNEMTQGEIFTSILNNGIGSFWKGFIPYFIRLSMHTMLTYLFLQQITDFYLFIDKIRVK